MENDKYVNNNSLKEIDCTLLLVRGAVIEEDLDSLKKKLDGYFENYQNVEITEENLKEAKESKAFLNKLKTSLEDRRKAIKSDYMIAYNEMEFKYKESTASLDALLSKFEKEIKEIETAQKEEKKISIMDIIDREIEQAPNEFKDYLKKFVFYKDEFLLTKWSANKIIIDIRTAVNDIVSNVSSLLTTYPDKRDLVLMLYQDKRSITAVMDKMNSFMPPKPPVRPIVEMPGFKQQPVDIGQVENGQTLQQNPASNIEQPAFTPQPEGQTLMQGTIIVQGTRDQLNYAVSTLRNAGIKIKILDKKEI